MREPFVLDKVLQFYIAVENQALSSFGFKQRRFLLNVFLDLLWSKLRIRLNCFCTANLLSVGTISKGNCYGVCVIASLLNRRHQYNPNRKG